MLMGNYMSFTPQAISNGGSGASDEVIFQVAFTSIIGDIPTSTGDGTICFTPVTTIEFTTAGDLYTYDGTLNTNVILPAGTDDYVLTADSSVTKGIKWAASTGGDVTVSGTPVNNQLTIWTDASTVEGDADLTWSGAALTVTGRATITDRTNIALINVDNYNGGALTSNGDYGYGSQVYLGQDLSTIIAGRTYRLDGTSWVNAVSNSTEAAASGLIAISTGTSSGVGMLLKGIVYTGTTGTGGDKVYLSSNGGANNYYSNYCWRFC